MKLHILLKNLSKYIGKEFLAKKEILDALIDFNVYEQYTGMEGIMRIMLYDGYMLDIINHATDENIAQKITSTLVRQYSLNLYLSSYAVESVCYACGILEEEPVFNFTQKNVTKKKTLTDYEWSKMPDEQKEEYLNSLVEIKKSNCGLTIESIYITYDDSEKDYCVCNYVIQGKAPKAGVRFHGAIYDIDGKLRSHQSFDYFYSPNFKGKCTDSYNSWKYRVNKTKIARIVFYFE